MKKSYLAMLCVILCLFLWGCGSSGNTTLPNNTDTGDLPQEIIEAIAASEDGVFDVQVEEKQIVLSLQEDEFVMGAHYEGEKQVFLIGNDAGEVYSYTPGQEKQLLLEGFSSTFVNSLVRWWKLGDQYYVVYNRFFTVFHEDGSRAFQVVMADRDRISDMCITENGRVAAVWYSSETHNTSLVEVNTTTGEMDNKFVLQSNFGIAGGSGAGVMLRDKEGIYTYDLKSGEKTWHMNFERTTYDPMMTENAAWDFRMTQEGDFLLLAKDYYADEWYEEAMSKRSFEDLGKTILVYQVWYATPELREVVTQFNKENEKYYVYMDERDMQADREDYKRQTGIELSAGKGADIIDFDCVDNIISVAEKGVFENLEPYMERSGMKTEDFFPYTLQDWGMGDGYYGIGIYMQLQTKYMKEEIAGDITSLDTLLTALENYEEDAVFSTIYERVPSGVLSYYLHMSNDMYGMVNWEEGTCDFSCDLWERMLESSLRYGQGEKKTESEVITYYASGGSFQLFFMQDMEARNQGMVPVGYPAEDGMLTRKTVQYVCVNAASENKEGAWEFIEYMLSSTGQQTFGDMYFPVVRSEYKTLYGKELVAPSIIAVVDYEPVYVTQEHMDFITPLLENSQVEPLHTEYVLEIIEDEVESYFNGTKTIEQVSEVINNRVQLYLDEQYN